MSTSGMTGARADAIELLTTQHREVEQLWSLLQTAHRDDDAVQAEMAQKIVTMLSQHDAIETQFLYPEVRKCGDEGRQLAEHSLEEHQQVRDLLTKVDEKSPADPSVFATMQQCVEAVLHHVQEEESQIFPLLRRDLDEPRLMDLGTKMSEALRMAPTHPPPHTPDSKFGATVAGAVSGVVDKARDAIHDAGDRS